MLFEAGFEEVVVYIGEEDNYVILEVLGEFSADVFDERIAKLPEEVRVWAKLTGSGYDTVDHTKAIAYQYAKNPNFGIRI